MRICFGKNPAAAIADLAQKIAEYKGDERGVVCAVDCLRQWDAGGKKLLERTIRVWEKRLAKSDGSHTEAHRHGAWVPAIPLEA
ncbi:hypothetical protein LCGC14_0163460 [marine sediment metagenome]|uniref:Uncharacterized protein n=1 Tax=marine sediment metagenome TaxID=412755 RepID=A0A0F9VAA3_9ZZZZ